MKIQSITNNNINTNFGMKFKLSNDTLKFVSISTKLSVDELRNLSLDDAAILMKERGAIKQPNKLKQYLADKYKKFGEKTGLLRKQHTFYSDGD